MATLNGSVETPTPPPEYARSFAQLGIRAQVGKCIELRVPTGGTWTRIELDEQAAEKLLKWLPTALAFALGEPENLGEAE